MSKKTNSISIEEYLNFFKEMQKTCKKIDYKNNQVIALIRCAPANCCSCPMLADNKKPRCFISNKFVNPNKKPKSCPIKEVQIKKVKRNKAYYKFKE